MFRNLKYIKLYDILSIFIFLLLIVPALIYRLYLKITGQRIWLITEEGRYARDNGYYFYRYAAERHDGVRKYFVIDKKAHDYAKVRELGHIIQFRSIRHWIYYLSSEYNISSHKNGNPAQALFYVLHVKLNLFNNRVFLQHGIIMNKTDYAFRSNAKFKYFVCGAKKEYEYIKKNFGYSEENLILSGLARYDSLVKNPRINHKQLLIMPTWRNWIGRETNALGKKEVFTDTEYYKNWNGLLNDPEFISFIEMNGIKVKFYLHAHMQPYAKAFKPKSPNVEVVSLETNIQDVLKSSAMMITDYSSVSMDFARLQKPLIYFQFDQKEFQAKQCMPGYFHYDRDGFGPVAKTISDTITALKKAYDGRTFKSTSPYIDRARSFFNITNKKTHCCETIYNSLAGNPTRKTIVGLPDLLLPFLYFCYIFSFNVYRLIDSSLLVSLLLLLCFIAIRSYRNRTISIIKSLRPRRSFAILSVLIAWSVFVVLANKSSDMSFLLNLAKIFITTCTGYMLFSLTDYFGRAKRVMNYILAVFAVQSIFECAFFLRPELSALFNYFRGDNVVANASYSTGYRGTAITKTPYFSLSIAYGVIIMLYYSRLNTSLANHKILKQALFLLILVGSMFAGRVGLIGLAFAPFMAMKGKYRIERRRLEKKKIIALIGAIFIATTGAVALVSSSSKIRNLCEYTFEGANNLFTGRGINTRSTNKLLKMLDKSFEPRTLLLGDGRFNDEGGKYYMQTDVGYYRKIYFGGVVCVILMLLWHLSLIHASSKNKELIAITIFLLIVEIKGVTVGQNLMIYSIISLLIPYSSRLHEMLYGNIKVSVLLPTLNTEPSYLSESVSSILTQTHSNFELIIIDDGSDNDERFIRSKYNDPRLKIIKHRSPQGIARSLNEAALAASGKYLVRMDADDISMPDRIERQVEFMENNPTIDISSTFYKKIGSNNTVACEAFTRPEDIGAKLLFIDPIAHPSVIMRRKLIDDQKGQLYDEQYERAEDYELWQRMTFRGKRVAIAKFYGIFYRVHSSQVSRSKRSEQLAQVKKIHLVALRELGIDASQEINLRILSGAEKLKSKQELRRFITDIIAANKKTRTYNYLALKKSLWSAYVVCCMKGHQIVIPNIYFIFMCIKKVMYRSRYYVENITKKRH